MKRLSPLGQAEFDAFERALNDAASDGPPISESGQLDDSSYYHRKAGIINLKTAAWHHALELEPCDQGPRPGFWNNWPFGAPVAGF